MNRILILDASASDYRTMSGLLMRAGYDPVIRRRCIYDEDLVHCKWLLSDNLYGRFFVLLFNVRILLLSNDLFRFTEVHIHRTYERPC